MMKKVAILLSLWIFISGCTSNKMDISAKLIGVGKNSDTITLLKDSGYTVIDVQSKSGIGRLELLPVDGEWPATTALRLHLRGLESLRISNGEFSIVTSVSSSLSYKQLCEVIYDNKKSGTVVTEDSDYWMQLSVVNKKESANLEIPLVDGYFEVILPAIIFNDNLDTIFVQWVDFYR